MKNGNAPKQVVEFLKKHGKEYQAALLPGILRGRVGNCFDTTIINAIHKPEYKYVEGVAWVPGPKMWVMHAWITDGENAFDPTWQCIDEEKTERPMPAGFKYVGIELDTFLVAEFMRETEYKCVLKNAWRNPELAAKILPAEFPIFQELPSFKN